MPSDRREGRRRSGPLPALRTLAAARLAVRGDVRRPWRSASPWSAGASDGPRRSGPARCAAHLGGRHAILAEPASQTVAVDPGRSARQRCRATASSACAGFQPASRSREGHAIAPGSWAVPLFGLPSLKAIVPAGVSGRTEIVIQLVGVDGTTLAEARTALVVGPPPPLIAAPAEKKAAASRRSSARALPPAPAPAAPPARRVRLRAGAPRTKAARGAARHPGRPAPRARQHRGRAAVLPARGGSWPAGSVPSRWPQPMILPSSSVSSQVQGVAADRAEARKWYERARELWAHRRPRIGWRASAAAEQRQPDFGRFGARGHPPAAVAPGRQRMAHAGDVGHGVEAVRAPGMASADPRQRQPAPAPRAVAIDRLERIFRAGRAGAGIPSRSAASASSGRHGSGALAMALAARAA